MPWRLRFTWASQTVAQPGYVCQLEHEGHAYHMATQETNWALCHVNRGSFFPLVGFNRAGLRREYLQAKR